MSLVYIGLAFLFVLAKQTVISTDEYPEWYNTGDNDENLSDIYDGINDVDGVQTGGENHLQRKQGTVIQVKNAEDKHEKSQSEIKHRYRKQIGTPQTNVTSTDNPHGVSEMIPNVKPKKERLSLSRRKPKKKPLNLSRWVSLRNKKGSVDRNAFKRLLRHLARLRRKHRKIVRERIETAAPLSQTVEPVESPSSSLDTVKLTAAILTTDENMAENMGRFPRVYDLHMFYRDHSVWVGAILGVLITMSLMVIFLAVYKLVLKYRRHKGLDIKNLSFSPFSDHRLDETPMYIRLSHIKNPKSGSHYVVSVLDDKKDENGWSSEEEVFNISSVKHSASASRTASPAVNKTTPVGTSTPLATPSKLSNNNNDNYSYK